jgi:hypothetical protein
LDSQLDALLATRAVITVQEHVTSSRPDGDVQTPNVYDDARTLRRIPAAPRARVARDLRRDRRVLPDA